MGVPQSHPLYSPLILQYSPTPSLTYTVPSLVSTHMYLISLTFSLGPDEVATVWWLWKLVCDLMLFTLFQQSRSIFLIWIQRRALTYSSIYGPCLDIELLLQTMWGKNCIASIMFLSWNNTCYWTTFAWYLFLWCMCVVIVSFYLL